MILMVPGPAVVARMAVEGVLTVIMARIRMVQLEVVRMQVDIIRRYLPPQILSIRTFQEAVVGTTLNAQDAAYLDVWLRKDHV